MEAVVYVCVCTVVVLFFFFVILHNDETMV